MKKTKLLKSLLVAAGLLVGASAWADDEVYSWNSSESAYTDQANPTTVYNGTSVDNLQIYYTQFRDWGNSDGTVKINTSGKIAFYKFDLSTIKSKLESEGGTITSVSFSFTGKTADGKDCQKIRALGYNAEWSASTITNNNISNSAGTIVGTVLATGSFQPLDDTAELTVNSEKTHTVNAMTYVKSAIDENKDYVSFAITANYTRAGLLNTSATLKVTYSTASRADYTINYQLDGTTVASESNSADIGSTVNAKNSIWNEGNTQKYFVINGATTSFNIEDDTNVFNVAVREAEIWTYYVKAFEGSTELMTISTNTVVEGESASYGYPQYIAVGGVLYKSNAQSSNPWWGESYIMTENNSVRGFQYAKEGNESIVFCSEAEDIDGLTVVSGGNTDIRASNRKGAYATEETTITTLEPGIYRVFGATYGNAGATFTLKAGNATVFTVATNGNPTHTVGDAFLITETTDLVMPAGGNGGSSPKVIDYIIVQKAGEYYETMSIVGDFSEGGFDDLTKGIVMTRDENDPSVWTAVVENYIITSAKYNYNYKAVANEDYAVYELPAGMNNFQNYNFDYDGARDGKYKLTFTANTFANTVEMAFEKQITGTIYYVNTWDWENVNAWVWNDSKNFTGGNWPGQAMTKTNEKRDGHDVYVWNTYELGTPTKVMFNYNGDANKTGEFAYENGATYSYNGTSTVSKTITAAGYATYCSDNALDFTGTGLTAYIAKKDASNKVTFSPVTKVPAKTGVLLKGAAGDYTINTTTEETDDVTGNVLIGVTVDTQVPAGSFVLMNGNKGVGFYKAANAFTVGANTAYIEALPTTARFIGFDFGDATAIEGVATVDVNNGQMYDLQGRRVLKAQKGLYIVNGKKVLVK